MNLKMRTGILACEARAGFGRGGKMGSWVWRSAKNQNKPHVDRDGGFYGTVDEIQ